MTKSRLLLRSLLGFRMTNAMFYGWQCESHRQSKTGGVTTSTTTKHFETAPTSRACVCNRAGWKCQERWLRTSRKELDGCSCSHINNSLFDPGLIRWHFYWLLSDICLQWNVRQWRGLCSRVMSNLREMFVPGFIFSSDERNGRRNGFDSWVVPGWTESLGAL